MVKKCYCPVCGYYLGFEAWKDDIYPSDSICPSCGIQFGYTDFDKDKSVRKYKYRDWRKKWIESGPSWSSVGNPQPFNWNPWEQMKNIPEEYQ